MSMKNLQFPLTDAQRAKRKELFETLLKEKEIQEFIHDSQCPQTVIEENASRFKRWLEDKRLAESLDAKSIRDDLRKGEYIDLVYDPRTGILSEVIVQLPVVSKLLAERKYLDQYRIFALPATLQDAHFDTLAGKIKNENSNYKKLFLELKKFVDNEVNGYYIYGDLGVGKSYLSACVTNAAAKKGYPVAFVHVPTLMSTLKQNFDSPDEIEKIIKMLKTVRYLVLDDFGAEVITSWSRDEIMLTILNARLENKLKTIVTGNYRPEHLKEIYQIDTRGVKDEVRARRLVDRVLALTICYEMVGENRRNLKN